MFKKRAQERSQRIEEELSLPVGERFAAVDPKLIAAQPPPVPAQDPEPEPPKIKSKSKQETKPHLKPKSETKAESKPKSKAKQEPQPKADSKLKSKSETKIQPKTKAKPEPKKDAAKSEPTKTKSKPKTAKNQQPVASPKRKVKKTLKALESEKPKVKKATLKVNKLKRAPKQPKQLIRPSKLGGFGAPPSFAPPPSTSSSAVASFSGDFSTVPPSERLFGSSPSDLIIEGKRQWKPSVKMQESGQMKKSISDYADAVANQPNKDKDMSKIGRILASQWDSRLRKVDNKFVNTNRAPDDDDDGEYVDVEEDKQPKALIRESKLVMNTKMLENLRTPSKQVEFYSAIQRSMQSADKTPPKLVEGGINPAGTAMVEDLGLSSGKSKSSKQKYSNRMPGNIVCGICGAVRYYSFILQAKKFGTFSCEPCRKFISRSIAKSKSESANSELFRCVSDTGLCVVPPVLRSAATTAASTKRKGEDNTRCQACWLKLCLIGYNLENELYDKLRSHLPKFFRELLPPSQKRSRTLVPHRGEILEFNRKVPLSRPLFDGFGSSDDVSLAAVDGGGGKPKKQPTKHVVHERLPNGWMKKAVKRLSGTRKGAWDMYLITPDQKILKSAPELKLYIAKSGAVIDANIVNFSLPKKTAKVDKVLQKKKDVFGENVAAASSSSSPKHFVREMKKLGHGGEATKGQVSFPKSSRRETKVPLKYRMDGDYSSDGRLSSAPATPKEEPKKKSDAAVKPEVVKKRKYQDINTILAKQEQELREKAEKEEEEEEKPSKWRTDDVLVAVKSQAPKPDLSSIGVGTFSIDADTARGTFLNSILFYGKRQLNLFFF